jgi:hypothetical protein
VALKVAPEQGWGIYWNEAHPDRPFTPVEVSFAPSVSGPTTQAAGPQHTAVPVASQSGAQSLAPGMLQIVSAPAPVAGVVAPLGDSGSGTLKLAGELTGQSSGTIGDSGTSDAATLGGLHLADGWFVVPSAANEYGQTYAALEGGFEFDVATGSFTSDWFWV